MSKGLTKRQKEVLNVIEGFIDTYGYSPTIRELGLILGISSTATIHTHLEKMKSKGYINYYKRKPRTLVVLKDDEE